MTAAKLKASILQLAISGKLVPQDPKDVPVAKPSVIDDPPYELPKGWVWKKLGEIATNYGQKKPDRPFCYIDVGSVNNQDGVLCDEEVVVLPENAPSRARKIVKHGVVLYSCVRPYLLNVCIVDRRFSHEVIASTAFAVLNPVRWVLAKYLFYYLRSPVFISYTNEVATGQAYPAISDANLYKGLIPIPPLAEQKRIVAKVEELMPLVEEYGKAYERRTELVGSLRDKLRKSVLQSAISGKLVPQDKSDEPATELLKRIAAEKAKLVKAGKIKKDKPLAPIEDDEKPFELPKGWAWCRLGDACRIAFSGRSPKYAKVPNDNYTIGQRNNQEYGIDFSGIKYSTDDFIKSYPKEYYLQDGDVILNTLGNGTLGRCGIFFGENGKHYITDGHLFVFRHTNLCSAMYMYYWFTFHRRFIEDDSDGSTNQAFLKLPNVCSYVFPLPPLAEQKRIVAKVEELFKLVDSMQEV